MISKSHTKSKLGLWLDTNELDDLWLKQNTGISLPIVIRLIYDDSFKPSGSVIRKVYSAIKKKDITVKLNDFWIE